MCVPRRIELPAPPYDESDEVVNLVEDEDEDEEEGIDDSDTDGEDADEEESEEEGAEVEGADEEETDDKDADDEGANEEVADGQENEESANGEKSEEESLDYYYRYMTMVQALSRSLYCSLSMLKDEEVKDSVQNMATTVAFDRLLGKRGVLHGWSSVLPFNWNAISKNSEDNYKFPSVWCDDISDSTYHSDSPGRASAESGFDWDSDDDGPRGLAGGRPAVTGMTSSEEDDQMVHEINDVTSNNVQVRRFHRFMTVHARETRERRNARRARRIVRERYDSDLRQSDTAYDLEAKRAEMLATYRARIATRDMVRFIRLHEELRCCKQLRQNEQLRALSPGDYENEPIPEEIGISDDFILLHSYEHHEERPRENFEVLHTNRMDAWLKWKFKRDYTVEKTNSVPYCKAQIVVDTLRNQISDSWRSLKSIKHQTLNRYRLNHCWMTPIRWTQQTESK